MFFLKLHKEVLGKNLEKCRAAQNLHTNLSLTFQEAFFDETIATI
jgi:hypothetical protein